MVASISAISPKAMTVSVERAAESGRRMISFATRLVSVAPIAIACLLGALSIGAEASNVKFIGNVSYKFVGNVAVLAADEITNFDSSGVSGSLHLELWAVAESLDGGPVTGYKLAEYALGQLVAGNSYSNISSGYVPFTPPPDGKWTFNMFVMEYTPNASVSDGCLPIRGASHGEYTACMHASGWIK